VGASRLPTIGSLAHGFVEQLTRVRPQCRAQHVIERKNTGHDADVDHRRRAFERTDHEERRLGRRLHEQQGVRGRPRGRDITGSHTLAKRKPRGPPAPASAAMTFSAAAVYFFVWRYKSSSLASCTRLSTRGGALPAAPAEGSFDFGTGALSGGASSSTTSRSRASSPCSASSDDSLGPETRIARGVETTARPQRQRSSDDRGARREPPIHKTFTPL